ncbi:MAG TPA: hypothetical protein VGH84_01155 [Steroidobacteraceae bacterium]
MLDNAEPDPADEEFQDCLRIAKATLTLLAFALDDEEGRLLAVLGAMTEMTLKHIADDDDRVKLTMDYVATLTEHMAG